MDKFSSELIHQNGEFCVSNVKPHGPQGRFLLFFYVEDLSCQNLLSRSQKFDINVGDYDEIKTLWISIQG